MKQVSMFTENGFSGERFTRLLVQDSPYFKIINFNFTAGQELPVHSHNLEGQVALTILEGEGLYLDGKSEPLPVKAGDVLISEIAEPHGLRATSDLRLLVVIAPPI